MKKHTSCFGISFFYYLCTESTINHTIMDIGKVIKERRAFFAGQLVDLARGSAESD